MMIAVRILAVLAWTLIRVLILPLAALQYINGILIREVLQPIAADLKNVRREAEKECGVPAVEAVLDA